MDGPLAGSSSEDLPPAVSENEEKSAAPSVSTGSKAITTKELSSSIVAVYEDGIWIASFTKGARTVRITGSARTFRDPTEGATGGVSHDQYVRLLSKPFSTFGDAEKTWLAARRTDTTPDVLAIGMQYLDGTALNPKYVFGNDYDDYLAEKNPARRGIDCSGFIRLVYGHRTSPALLSGGLLPRVSKNQLANGTGVLTVANDGKQPTAAELQRLRVGDLVFFDVSARNDDTGGIESRRLLRRQGQRGSHALPQLDAEQREDDGADDDDEVRPRRDELLGDALPWRASPLTRAAPLRRSARRSGSEASSGRQR